MQPGTLQEILGVEKEIQERIDAEREKAGQWLENEKRQLEAAHRSEMARLRTAAGEADEAAQQAAREMAAGIVRQAEEAARAVDRLPDTELRRRVVQGISVICPGASSAR